MTPIEEALLVALWRSAAWNLASPIATLGPYAAYLQYEVEGHRVDLALISAERRIAVEADGHPWHERSPEQAARDRARDRALQRAGWMILRFTGTELVRDGGGCAREILGAMGFTTGLQTVGPSAEGPTKRIDGSGKRLERAARRKYGALSRSKGMS